jgi:hypothetical protein
MGDYARSVPMFSEAADIDKRLLDADHPRYAASVSNLANTLKTTAKYTLGRLRVERLVEMMVHIEVSH